MEHVLAVDLGTGGPKVALVAADGTICDAEHGTTHVLLGPGGAAEQDPADWWRAISDAVGRLLGRGLVDRDDVVAVAVTSQWCGTVAVGADGQPLMNALIWMDSRGARYIRDIMGGPVRYNGYDVRKLHKFISRAGGLPGPSGKDPTAHIAWIRHERPAIYDATRVFLEPPDYLNLRLTGRTCSSYDCIALHWVTDNRDVNAVHYDEDLLALSHLDRRKLPELVPPATVIGTLLPTVAAEWGLSDRTAVVTASGDVASAVVGSGALGDYRGHLYIGTSSWLTCHVPWKHTDVLHTQTTLPAALPGRYYIVNEHETAGACLTFLKDNLRLRPDGVEADAPDGEVFGALDAMAERSPAGAGKVVFTPWLNGDRTPVEDRTVRGGFHNLSLTTTREQMVRAVYEGVAYDSRRLLEVVEPFIHRPMASLAFIGGGANSALWAQIHADVLGRVVRRMAQPQLANVRGAGLIAIAALELGDIDAIAARLPVASEHRPDARKIPMYDELYDAFSQIYKHNRRLYARLNRR